MRGESVKEVLLNNRTTRTIMAIGALALPVCTLEGCSITVADPIINECDPGYTSSEHVKDVGALVRAFSNAEAQLATRLPGNTPQEKEAYKYAIAKLSTGYWNADPPELNNNPQDLLCKEDTPKKVDPIVLSPFGEEAVAVLEAAGTPVDLTNSLESTK